MYKGIVAVGIGLTPARGDAFCKKWSRTLIQCVEEYGTAEGLGKMQKKCDLYPARSHTTTTAEER